MNEATEKQLELLSNEELIHLYEEVLKHLKFLDTSILDLESEGNEDE